MAPPGQRYDVETRRQGPHVFQTICDRLLDGLPIQRSILGRDKYLGARARAIAYRETRLGLVLVRLRRVCTANRHRSFAINTEVPLGRPRTDMSEPDCERLFDLVH